MMYTVEFNVDSFEFWSGAKQRVDNMAAIEREVLGQVIEEIFVDEQPTETQINDFVWFDWDEMRGEYGFADEDE